MNKLLRVLSYHVWLAATQMPCDGHLKTGLSDIRHLPSGIWAFSAPYLALVDGPMLSSAREDTHGLQLRVPFHNVIPAVEEVDDPLHIPAPGRREDPFLCFSCLDLLVFMFLLPHADLGT
ncbi:hypothetical protein Celaphus_00000932 [Cervus elaphus hippelaphus]|uniref:Uncharacterized protein n=1 Tax=Cervus elaphus hippelaphus TaxID=46360 RepID=A0A212D7V0_CEREH|nr:hypothetical protein Celaphus_00000932 [Cervus elaphus hippelaphus]